MENERDEAKHETKVTRLAANAAGEVRTRAEEDLARVQEALATAEEGRSKAKAGTASLEVERTSLPPELRAAKVEVSSLHSQASRDKEAMEEEYQKAMEVIFAYEYGCCVSKHNICGDHPKVPNGMPDSADTLPAEFFVNPGCPLSKWLLRPQRTKHLRVKRPRNL